MDRQNWLRCGKPVVVVYVVLKFALGEVSSAVAFTRAILNEKAGALLCRISAVPRAGAQRSVGHPSAPHSRRFIVGRACRRL